jgi:hypothetical protein
MTDGHLYTNINMSQNNGMDSLKKKSNFVGLHGVVPQRTLIIINAPRFSFSQNQLVKTLILIGPTKIFSNITLKLTFG